MCGEVQAVFDKASGWLCSFGRNANILQKGPRLHVWRAATDNDGYKLLLTGRDEWYVKGKALPCWLKLGLDQLGFKLTSMRLARGRNPQVEIIQQASGREQWNDFLHIQRFHFLSSGELQVENEIKLGGEICDIPRLGVSMVLVPGLENITYFGRGPWENYSDRKTAAMMGLFTSTVSNEYVPYIMPQEHGHHLDVRFLSLTDEHSHGLTVQGQPVFEFNLSHFTDDDLYAARHTCDLKMRPETILNLDIAQRGLGTASCGPDTLEQYRLNDREYGITYRLEVK
jgi:beta-galactosidase